ncbi:acyl-CoA dehydrogenase family protein [Actinomadura algeriensis]|uniref:Alkylation response protein AidB-like acyl-CoA dehydrogenase n=1 Tax=Actinomadura algeriensis TaxID=1679523 RepID=A0ABR9JZT2_9ACTN|nr:acyl-CoA dehydrogenase family protein [Actinomadura algeriensis]MBE1535889.1 alkylation response protein AidB-like acyl-CoA dehydrogenase [Actinomadura algeriensis]
MPKPHELVAERTRRLVEEHPPGETPVRDFLAARFDAGLAWVRFPEGLGGLGLPHGLQPVSDAIVEAAGGPDPFALNPMGYGMAGPTLVAHGSPELRRRLLRPLYVCDDIWCQLFSEPGAGSDLAGLATRATRGADGAWTVDGRKVWTSKAHEARWALLLARTDPDVPKHAGLTYFVLDMRDPGVEVRPLRQMTGDADFNEVRLDGARIPDDHRLGPAGAGWRVAMTTLANERSAIGGGSTVRGAGPIAPALELWRDRPDLRTPVRRDRLVSLFARADALRLTGIRYAAAPSDYPNSPEGTLGKLVDAELNQDVLEFCVEMLGAEATAFPSYEPGGDPAADAARRADVRWRFLRSRANTIEGGTAEVLRNVLGERALGLPGDVRVDKDRPWRDVPRG